MLTKKTIAHRLPFYYGWVIVAIGVLAAPFFGSLTSWGLGVLIVPMEEELGWSRSLLFAPLAVGAVVSSVLGILVGPWLDRKNGPAALFAIGVVVFGISTMLIGYVHSIWAYFLAFGVLGGVGRYGVQVIFAIVPKWFVRQRGVSQAMIGAGFSIGPLVFPVLLQYLIDSIGWRDTWVVMGVLFLALVGPSSLLVARSPEDLGLLPDGEAAAATAGSPAGSADGGRDEPVRALTRAQAMHSRQLWLIIGAIALATLAIRGMIPNLHPFFVSEGISARLAAFSFSVYAIIAFLTVLFWGRLADRIGARLPFILVLAIGLAGLVLLGWVGPPAIMFLGMIVLALGLNGFFNLWQVVLADTFGRQHIGAIRGVVDAFNTSAIFLGPVAFGLLLDVGDNYTWLFVAAVVLWALSLLSAVLVKPLNVAVER